jgi:hypothetical protein
MSFGAEITAYDLRAEQQTANFSAVAVVFFRSQPETIEGEILARDSVCKEEMLKLQLCIRYKERRIHINMRDRSKVSAETIIDPTKTNTTYFRYIERWININMNDSTEHYVTSAVGTCMPIRARVPPAAP